MNDYYLMVILVWGLTWISFLTGFWLGRSRMPSEDLKSIGEAVRPRLPSMGKGEVVHLSDEELAVLEQKEKNWTKPHDPNEGVPKYPGTPES